MAKIFVVAGTTEQARLWIKEHLKKRMDSGETTLSHSDYVTVDSPMRIRGIADPHGVFIGTWKERKDILEVVETLIHHSIGLNDKLKVIQNDLWKRATSDQVSNHTAAQLAKEIDAEALRSLKNMVTNNG